MVSADGGTRWGYHQLTDRWAARLVYESLVRPGDLVLDVGAGTGALTVHLLAVGARVIAVETHPGRARILRERFGRDIIVVRADAGDLRLPKRPFRVVANPPFASGMALLRRLVSPGSRMISAEVVLPAHMAARWVAGRAPGANRWSRIYRVQAIIRLPVTAFRPPATQPTACRASPAMKPAPATLTPRPRE